MESIKEFGGNELALAGAVKEDLACSGSSPLNKSDQVISAKISTEAAPRAPGPGHKQQATSNKLQSFKPQATCFKPQATSIKLQAASDKLFNFTTLIKFQAASVEARG